MLGKIITKNNVNGYHFGICCIIGTDEVQILRIGVANKRIFSLWITPDLYMWILPLPAITGILSVHQRKELCIVEMTKAHPATVLNEATNTSELHLCQTAYADPLNSHKEIDLGVSLTP